MVIRSVFSKSIVKETIMPRKVNRNNVDLSTKAGNPTHAIQAVYAELMDIPDPAELRRRAIEVVEPLVGHGMSQANFKKFLFDLDNSSKKGITDLKMYLSNYVLKGTGHGVLFRNSVEAIAACISEDVNEVHVLSPRLQQLKFLIESKTDFTVVPEKMLEQGTPTKDMRVNRPAQYNHWHQQDLLGKLMDPSNKEAVAQVLRDHPEVAKKLDEWIREASTKFSSGFGRYN